MDGNSQKLPLKTLLERHNIAFADVYEFCETVDTMELQRMYSRNQYTRLGLARLVAFINLWAGTSYTVDNIYVERFF